MERIRYFFKEGLRSIWINRMMSAASIIVLGVCLIMLGTTILTSLNINNFITQLESKDQIMVYLNNNITQSGIDQVGDAIKAIPNVSDSTFLTKDQIFAQAKQTLGNEDVLLTGINSSAFDSAYQVKISDMSKYSQTVTDLSKISGVKLVQQDAGLAALLYKVRRVVSIAGFWLFVVMAVISLFIISNTIKLAMFSRKREINIMKFVGATDWFIRWPFIIEGVLIGLVASAAALLVQWYIYTRLISGFIKVLNVTTPLSYSGAVWFIAPGFLIAGMLVGALGSVMSLHKYLKV